MKERRLVQKTLGEWERWPMRRIYYYNCASTHTRHAHPHVCLVHDRLQGLDDDVIEAVTETFEFVDTDGDSNLLAMIDDNLQWLVIFGLPLLILKLVLCKAV